MLRDFKLLRSNSSKSSNAPEVENMPPKSGDFVLNQTSSEPPRPPLNAIQEPFRIPRGISYPETGGSRSSRHDKTPVKQKPSTYLPLRTPEKHGAKDRCNLAKKFDCSLLETKDEVKTVTNMNTPGSFRVFGRCNSSNSDCTSTQSTPTKSVNKAGTPGYNIASVSRPPLSVGSRLPNVAALNKGNLGPGNFCSVVNTLEVPYFELKEDSSFWMEHNVQVLIRIRPLNSMEKSTVGFNRCLKQESSQSVTWIGQPETRFHFDHVACEAIDQETLFRMVGLPMVENCLSGYNSCMFAYGQTGSGKTHTMLGEIDGIEVNPSANRGMTPRVFEFLFARIIAEEESRRDERLKYNCKCSFLEIYNEQITDLLDPSSTNLMLREDMKKGVYVEDLSEFEVRNVGDILQLLTLGSSNRRVAATNMNKESSRSHSVFTCVIESRWEKDSTTNYRFAQLNLVDLAGSERQKTSGADGERLKEAVNINKSLSTLGHVIMVLVDIANGKPRHVPYRDSRLTFLLQDSLGGNSKTVIIANVSPSVCSSAETLNTLKFAQRAKLIQNNAIINEDSSRDVQALKIQIQLLKNELSALKREKLTQPLPYVSHIENKNDEDCNEMESKRVLRISSKQLKSLETTLSGSLRREQMADMSTKQREAEIEHLNRLVSQREEDTRCAKMMLKFREDKIQRLESLNGGLMSADDYLMRENHALSEEIQLLRSRIDKNPEVTRFALENIRLLEKVQQFQDLYDEGEREMLMTEISELRNQVIFFLERESKNQNYSKSTGCGEDENDSLQMELNKTMSELEETRIKLKCCQEENAMIRREFEEMHQLSNRTANATQEHDCNTEIIKDSIVDGPIYGNIWNYGEDIMNLQLELDILKIILKEERSSRFSLEEMLKSMSQELQLSTEKVHSTMKECTEVQEVLSNMKLVVEALESQQIELINEIENLNNSNDHYQGLVKEQELEIKSLRDLVRENEMRNVSTSKSLERENSVIETKLKKMHESLEKAKRLNVYFQNDDVFREYDVVEMEDARKQVEAETAEVIVSLQDELSGLQKEIEYSKVREMESRENLEQLKKDCEILKSHLYSKNQENEKLVSMVEEKEEQLSMLMEECSSFVSEIESNLHTGNEALEDVTEQVDAIRGSFSLKENCVIQKFGRIKASILEKELLIDELTKCLKEAVERRDDVDFMLRSLRGAVMGIVEAHQQECSDKDKEILLLTSELNNKTSAILEVLSSQKNGEYHLEAASCCAEADSEEVVVQTQETIKELASGISALTSCIGQFVMEYGGDPRENKVELSPSLCSDNECGISQGDKNSMDKSTNDAGSCPYGDYRNVSVLTLKREADYALQNLQGMHLQMNKLSAMKVETIATEKCRQQILESLSNQAILLQNGITNFGIELESRVNEMESKIGKIENLVQHSFVSVSRRQELLEAEADLAKAIATEKIAEASSVLEKFEEVQDTMKEADIMINELMITNEALKLSLGELKAKEHELSFQQALLLDEVQSLNISSEQKDRKYGTLENMYETDLMVIKGTILELEKFVSESQIALDKELASTSTYLSMNSQLHQSVDMCGVMLEEVWSEIIMKDCAASVLKLCHVEVMETLNGLNAENRLLCYDLSESRSMVSELQEQNFRVRRELEISSAAKVNRFADIQKMVGFISSKLSETGEVSLKLASFEMKMEDLQHKEERMSQGYVIVGSELDELMKELESSIEAMNVCILDRERLVHEKDVQLQYKEEALMINLLAKDIGFFILSTELEQMALQKKDLENSCVIALNILDAFKKDVVLKGMDAAFSSLISLDQELDNDHLLNDLERTELALQTSFLHINELNKQIQTLQNAVSLQKDDCSMLVYELQKKDEEVHRMNSVEKENEELQRQLANCKSECASLAQQLDCRKAEFEVKNNKQRDEITSLEAALSQMQAHAEENMLLRNDFTAIETSRVENLRDLNMKYSRGVDLTKNIHELSSKIINLVSGNSILQVDDMFEKVHNEIDKVSVFMKQFEYLENLAMQIDSKILSLVTDVSRKDDVLKGLLFDLSLLQESASNFKDQKDEMEKLQASLSAMEESFESKSLELEQAISRVLTLENQLQEKTAELSALEWQRASDHEMISSLSNRNTELLASVNEALNGKNSALKELMEARVKIEKLEVEISEMETAMAQMSRTTESLQSELDTIIGQRDELDGKFCILTRELELARALAEDKEAVAFEAQEIAQLQKLHAEEKETEAKLLERSIEELECTINALERKVDIIKGEAEQQRLQREELELELLGIKEHMRNVNSNDLDIKRCLDEKEKTLQDALRRVQLLEKEIAARDREISKCRSHISDLNLHAEAQANEYKQKFKALEIMVEQLKSEASTTTTHCSTSSSNKLEKSASKPKGSGSPFKCIGLGLVQQLKSEKDEELSVGRQRIEELETLAASRQKEIFMLKARLATTESMTHDVIRDLLGVKLNMKSYAELMENQQLNLSTEEAAQHKVEADAKEQEVVNLKQQINEFVQERNGWLEEIERKQAEMMAAHVALETLRRQEQLCSTENDILKMENANQKKRVMELESEIKKLSVQQNIQQRIHHHAKIKEENNLLRFKNEELSFNLQRTEAILSRVEKELAQFRMANGRSPYINFDEEQFLDKKLKETERERMELAQKLLGLCTSVLKAAGIKRPTSEISPSVAEEALEHLKNKFISLEMELEDAKLKNRISSERARLSELRPQASSAVSPSTNESHPGQNRMPQITFISKFDR